MKRLFLAHPWLGLMRAIAIVYGLTFLLLLVANIPEAGATLSHDPPPVVVPIPMLDQTPRPAAEAAPKQAVWIVLFPVLEAGTRASCAA